MAIKEITDKLGGVPVTEDSDNPSLHRAWEISINRQALILKRYGSFCMWNKIILEKDNKEVYRIQIKPYYKGKKMKDAGTRIEFFNNEFFRAYQGDRFSFIEYLDIAGQTEKIPQRKKLISSGLDKKLTIDYEIKLKQILSN